MLNLRTFDTDPIEDLPTLGLISSVRFTDSLLGNIGASVDLFNHEGEADAPVADPHSGRSENDG